jgi:BASS family bile acid:Na+ symporter
MTDIDLVRVNLDETTLQLLNFCLMFLTFGIALDIRLDDFRQLILNPRKVLTGLFSQMILLPIYTLILIYMWQPPPSVALGMVLVAACPGGNVSNYTTHLAKGNTALSVTMTSLVTMASILTTPLIFWICARLIPGAQELLIRISLDPVKVFLAILQLIVAPLLAGLYLAHRFPNFIARVRRPVKVISMVIFLAIIVGALLGNIDNIRNHLGKVFFLVLLHNGIAYAIGYYFARATRLPERDARAIALETGIQNSGLGLILILSFFHGLGGMTLVAAWWGVWDLVSSFVLAMFWSKRPPAYA